MVSPAGLMENGATFGAASRMLDEQGITAYPPAGMVMPDRSNAKKSFLSSEMCQLVSVIVSPEPLYSSTQSSSPLLGSFTEQVSLI